MEGSRRHHPLVTVTGTAAPSTRAPRAGGGYLGRAWTPPRPEPHRGGQGAPRSLLTPETARPGRRHWLQGPGDRDPAQACTAARTSPEQQALRRAGHVTMSTQPCPVTRTGTAVQHGTAPANISLRRRCLGAPRLRDRPPSPRTMGCRLLELAAMTQDSGRRNTAREPPLPRPCPTTCELRVALMFLNS